MLLTLRAIAEKLAARDGRDAERVHTQLRNSTIRGLMEAAPGERASTSAVKYPSRELIRARVVLALIDMSFDVLTIGEFNDALLRVPRPSLGEHKTDFTTSDAEGLDALIDGARTGEDWELRIRFTRANGERSARATLAKAHRDHGRKAKGIVDSARQETLLGEVIVPVSDLIRPLLGDLDG